MLEIRLFAALLVSFLAASGLSGQEPRRPPGLPGAPLRLNLPADPPQRIPAAPGAPGAGDAFLSLEGIPGESTDGRHRDEIEVLSFNLAIAQQAAHLGGGAGAGKVEMKDLLIVKAVDKASPRLFLACAAGERLKKAVLTVRRPGGDRADYLRIVLTDVLVTSVRLGGGGAEGRPQEEVSLDYGRIELEYTAVDQAGKGQGPVRAGWDVKANKKV
jgi:type VI secretion system secreted protein Hcp